MEINFVSPCFAEMQRTPRFTELFVIQLYVFCLPPVLSSCQYYNGICSWMDPVVGLETVVLKLLSKCQFSSP